MKLGIDKIAKLISRYSHEPLSLRHNQCLNARFKDIGCSRCAEICPADLIDPKALEEIDQNRCAGCGLCASACPTGAIEMKEPSDLALITRIGKLLGKEKLPIRFRCRTNALQSANGFLTLEVPCLGRLNEGILTCIAANGAHKLWLDTSACSECALASEGIGLASSAVKTAQVLLEAFSIDCTLEISPLERAFDSVPAAGNELIDTSDKVSRRQFLSHLQKELRTAVTMIAFAGSPKSEKSISKYVPLRRSVLFEHGASCNPNGKPALCLKSTTLTRVSIKRSRCDLCEQCAFFCPTGALERKETDGRVTIEFDFLRCVACGLCKSVCESKAVRFLDRVGASALKQPKPLVEYEVRLCSSCNQPFGAAGHQSLCRYCRRRAQLFGDLA